MSIKQIRGLKSLNEALLSRIDENKNENKENKEEDDDKNALSSMILKLKKKESENKNKKYADILHHFTEDIIQHVSDISIENITEIAIFVIKYMEKNSVELALHLQVKKSGDFKLEMAINFINQLIKDEMVFLPNMINSLHILLYPKVIQKKKTEKKKLFT